MSKREVIALKDWDWTAYPEKDRYTGAVMFSRWRLIYPSQHGGVKWQNFDPTDFASQTAVDMSSKHRAMEMWTAPVPQDVRWAVSEIVKQGGGKPFAFYVGLWWHPKESGDNGSKGWAEDDFKLTPYPYYWLDMTRKFFDEWWPEAFSGFPDPFRGVKSNSPMDEAEKKAKELADKNALIAQLQAQVTELENKTKGA